MKHQIEIPDLPEGWEAVDYRVPKGNIEFVFIENVVREAKPQDKKCLIVEKIQPRRIVLEETEEDTDNSHNHTIYVKDITIDIYSDKLWKIVDEKEENQNV